MRTTNKPQNVSDESNIFVKKKKIQKLQNLTVLQDLKELGTLDQINNRSFIYIIWMKNETKHYLEHYLSRSNQ